MIKINIVSDKNDEKNIISYFLASFFAKTYKTILINIDAFNNLNDVLKNKTDFNKFEFNNLNYKINNISKNFDIFFVPILTENYINIANYLASLYEVVIINNVGNLINLNPLLINDSDLLLILFGLKVDINQLQKNILTNLIKNNIKTIKTKFLALLTNDFNFNSKQILIARKVLMNLLLQNTIPPIAIKKIEQTLNNKTFKKTFDVVFNEIKNLVFNML